METTKITRSYHHYLISTVWGFVNAIVYQVNGTKTNLREPTKISIIEIMRITLEIFMISIWRDIALQFNLEARYLKIFYYDFYFFIPIASPFTSI